MYSRISTSVCTVGPLLSRTSTSVCMHYDLSTDCTVTWSCTTHTTLLHYTTQQLTLDVAMDDPEIVDVTQSLQCLRGVVTDHVLIQSLFGQRPYITLRTILHEQKKLRLEKNEKIKNECLWPFVQECTNIDAF